jgi:pimeloyl-ACP methyl ester carboxylesterase
VPPLDWWAGAKDVIELLDREAGPVIGVGHSAGGAQLMMAELELPGRFAGLVLVEPIVFPPPYGRFPDNPMSNAARRRRDRFRSRQEAFDNWNRKPAFAAWDDRALWAYVDGGLRPEADHYVLKCSRDIEAETFIAATEHRAWDRLSELEVETLVVAGEHSTTHQERFLEDMTERMGRASYEIIPGTSHLVWMERPDLIAAAVAQVVDRVS